MRIDMADFRGDKKYAYYNFFMVGNAASKYKLQVADYKGTAGDSILYGSGGYNLNGMAFSTHDSDNDLHDGNCATPEGRMAVQPLHALTTERHLLS